MSGLGNWMRGTAVAVFTALTGASDSQMANAQGLVLIFPQHAPDRADAALIREYSELIALSLFTVGHALHQEKTDPGTAAQPLAKSVRLLQELMMTYRTLQLDNTLPEIRADGTLGPDTALLAIRIAARENIAAVFTVPAAGITPKDAAALTTLHDHLAFLRPAEYIAALRDRLTAQTRQTQQLARLNVSTLHRAFNECVYSDARSYAPEIVSEEVNRIAASPRYISPYINGSCTDILGYMSAGEREKAQINYLNARAMPPERQEVEWCAVMTPKGCHLVKT